MIREYNETNYLSYQDLNTIENKIDTLNQQIRDITAELPVYEKHTWSLNDFVYIQLVDHIEKAISAMSFYFFRPNGYIPDKIWLKNEFDHPLKSFDYSDINRWINNLTLLENNLNYEGDLWNIQSNINWNETSDEEWEEFI